MIEVVIKCGGSLTRGDGLPILCRQLARLAHQHRLLVVPGGGPFADAVRGCDRRYRLTDTVAHWMAVLAMDQYGYLLHDLIPHSQPLRDPKDAHAVASAGRIPVLLPFDLLYRTDPLPHGWAVTSDTISAWIAESVGAPRLVLLKDVDGLYRNVRLSKEKSGLLESVSVGRLSGCEGVDRFLATFLDGKSFDLWIINGNEPDRLQELLVSGKTHGTHLQR